MSWVLFLDDLRDPPEGMDARVARTMPQAVQLVLELGAPQHVCFDHDLGEKTPSGFDFAKWLVERDLDQNGNFLPSAFTYTIHSANPPGAQNIEGLLTSYLAHRAPEAARSPARHAPPC